MDRPERSPIRQFLMFLELRIRFVVILLVVGGVVYFHDEICTRFARMTESPRAEGLKESPGVEWYCPMDEAVVRSEPASCPLCGMPLSRRTRGVDGPLPVGVVARIGLAPGQIQLGGVRTAKVEPAPVERSFRTGGVLSVHPRHRTSVTAKVRSRIESVSIVAPGTFVKKDDELLKVYSPELINAQQVYLQLCKSRASLAAGAGTPGELPMTARERPLQLGLTKMDLEELERTEKVRVELPLRAPCDGTITRVEARIGEYVNEGDVLYELVDLSMLWVEFGVPVMEVSQLTVGDALSVRVPNDATERVTAIESIEPVPDASTRTHRVRAELPNAAAQLRPGALVEIEVRLRRAALDASETRSQILSVPLTAIVPAPNGSLVYREVRDGVFEAVIVVLGPRYADHVEVRGELNVGDRIAVAGAFFLDAEATWHGRRAAAPMTTSSTEGR